MSLGSLPLYIPSPPLVPRDPDRAHVVLSTPAYSYTGCKRINLLYLPCHGTGGAGAASAVAGLVGWVCMRVNIVKTKKVIPSVAFW